MISSLVILAALGAASPDSSSGAVVPWLEFQHAVVKTTSASLLSESAPFGSPIFDVVMMGDIRIAMANEMTQFANAILPAEGRPVDTAGSGDDVGGLALLCGILGFFPGFGIGHLVAGNISGFILFLVIDLVMAAVFFVLFPTVFWFSFWYLPGVILFVVERVVEAFLAADSATRYRGYRGYGDADPVPGGGLLHSLPPVRPAFTLMRF
jgi:hypothetical protein